MGGAHHGPSRRRPRCSIPEVLPVPTASRTGSLEGARAGVRGAVAVGVPVLDPIEQARWVIRRRGKDLGVLTVIERLACKKGRSRTRCLSKRAEASPHAQSSSTSTYCAAETRRRYVGRCRRLTICRRWDRPCAWVHIRNVTAPISDAAILHREHEVLLPVRAAIDLAYERRPYTRQLGSDGEPAPPLCPGNRVIGSIGSTIRATKLTASGFRSGKKQHFLGTLKPHPIMSSWLRSAISPQRSAVGWNGAPFPYPLHAERCSRFAGCIAPIRLE